MVANKRSVALVVPNLANSGGVSSVARFVSEAIRNSGSYSVDLVSLATSMSDEQSISIMRASTWVKGIRGIKQDWNGQDFLHMGANLVELEFMRYMPRRSLTRMLNRYDLVQIVAGAPAWAYVARDVSVPVALQVATLAQVERARRSRIEGGPSGIWRRAMTRITSAMEERGLACADAVLVENQWMYDRVLARLGPDRVIMAPPGVDTDVFHPRDSESPRREPYILSVGRFADPRKNVPLLFEAYAQVRKTTSDAPKLILAGKSSPTDSDWELAMRLGIRQHIAYCANASTQRLAELYRNCHAFVLASDEEGFGMVLIEAMASGVPVVSTACGGPEMIVEDAVTGFLVPVGDSTALAARISQLIRTPPLARRMGRRARAAVCERFSLHATKGAYIDTYDRLLSRQ